MNAFSSILIIVGVLLLIMTKVELGNRDGNYLDAMIEQMRPKAEKEKSLITAFWLAIIGLTLIAAGLVLAYI